MSDLVQGGGIILDTATYSRTRKSDGFYQVLKTHSCEAGNTSFLTSRDKTPDYHTLVKEKKLIPPQWYDKISYSSDHERSKNRYHFEHALWYFDWEEFSPNKFTATRLPDGELTERFPDPCDSNAVITEAAANAISGFWDPLTLLAELPETLMMFTSIGARLGGYMASRKASWTSPWLEARYGWRTLYYDVQELYEFLSKETLARRIKGSSAPTTEVDSDVAYKTASYSTCRWTTKRTDSYSVSCRGLYVADIHPQVPVFANPGVTAWEAVPLSFVVDWFLNVGAYLKAYETISLSTNAYASYGLQYELDSRIILTDMVGINGYTPTDWAGDFGYKTVRRQRQIVDPAFTPSVPMRVNLNIAKIVDLIAIIVQRAANLKRRK